METRNDEKATEENSKEEWLEKTDGQFESWEDWMSWMGK